jgi:hypothetical protein
MANNSFFGRKDSLWGGETLTSTETNDELGVETNDRFRIEKGPNNKLTLIPHPANLGTWKETHSKTNPIKLKKFRPTDFERAFAMMVTIKAGAQPMKLFLIERENGTIAVSDSAKDPGSNGGTAAVER